MSLSEQSKKKKACGEGRQAVSLNALDSGLCFFLLTGDDQREKVLQSPLGGCGVLGRGSNRQGF